MQIRVLFFASCADIVGHREQTVELAEGSVLDDLMDAVIREHPRLEPIRKSAMISLNQDYAEGGAALSGGDEVALIPPVSGGC
jgi:molybdopterin converting factor subunit 1